MKLVGVGEKHGAASPVSGERQGFLTVTFKTQMVASAGRVESLRSIEDRITVADERSPLSKAEIAAIGRQKVDGQLHLAVCQLLQTGLIKYTLPDTPNSRLQKYRLTGKEKTSLGGKNDLPFPSSR